MNTLTLAGRLGSDPEERMTPGGQKVTTFRMAVRTWRKGAEETIWFRVTAWGDRFDRIMGHLKKGSAVIVVGELQKPDIFNDRNGQPQVGLEVTAEMIKFSPFGGKGDGQESSGQAPQANMAPRVNVAPQQPVQQPAMNGAGLDDDLPF
jgi:single-strand DNA-binding protein